MVMLTHERLLAVLRYDPETGDWTALVRRGKVRAGQKTGVLNVHGYIQVTVDRVIYRSHRLAWFYMKGEWPVEVDHWDLDKTNNRWTNLRDATHAENGINRPIQKNNTSGFKGVTYMKGRKKRPWKVEVGFQGKKLHIGTFASKEEAGDAYLSAAKRLFGEFARAA